MPLRRFLNMDRDALRAAFMNALAMEGTNWGGGSSASDADPYLNQALAQVCETYPVYLVEKVLAATGNEVTWIYDDLIPSVEDVAQQPVEVFTVEWRSTSNMNRYFLEPRSFEDLAAKFTRFNRTPFSGTLDNDAVLNDGGFAKFKVTGNTLIAGDIVTIDGTTNFDGTHLVTNKITDYVTLDIAFTAETPAGTETIVTAAPTPTSIQIEEYSYDPKNGLCVYPAVSGEGTLWVNWQSYLGDVPDGGIPERYIPHVYHHFIAQLGAWLYMVPDADGRADPTYQRIVLPHEVNFERYIKRRQSKPIKRFGRYRYRRGL